MDFVTILQEELIRARVLPQNYDFEAHEQLYPCDVLVTFTNTAPLEQDFGFRPATQRWFESVRRIIRQIYGINE